MDDLQKVEKLIPEIPKRTVLVQMNMMNLVCSDTETDENRYIIQRVSGRWF